MTVLSVVEGNNARLIAEAAKLYIRPGDLVVDLTYGRGRFWTEFRPDNLVTNDLHVDSAEHRYDYKNPPKEWRDRFRVVVLDPPYVSTGSRDKSTLEGRSGTDAGADFHRRYGLDHTEKGYKAVFTDVKAGLRGAERITKRGGIILVKVMDYVESGQIRWGRRNALEAADELGLRQVDEFIHFSGTGAQPKTNLDGSPRRQVHSRRAHSFLLVFDKPQWHVKNPEAWLNSYLRRTYGITTEQWRALYESQGGRCAICKTEEPGGKHSVFCVDHDHTTGEVRGLLCHRCNVGLGQFEDDPIRLKEAFEYLAKGARCNTSN